MKPGEKKSIDSVLSSGSESEFWKELKEYIDHAADPKLFLKIDKEMGMKGFWYMRGYINAMNDLVRRVESARLATELIKKSAPTEG